MSHAFLMKELKIDYLSPKSLAITKVSILVPAHAYRYIPLLQPVIAISSQGSRKTFHGNIYVSSRQTGRVPLKYKRIKIGYAQFNFSQVH